MSRRSSHAQGLLQRIESSASEPKLAPAEKEISHELFNSVEYGRYKYSVDEGTVEPVSPEWANGHGESSMAATAGYYAPPAVVERGNYPEAIAPHELPNDGGPDRGVQETEKGGAETKPPRRICGLAVKWLIGIATAVGLIAVALIAGLAGGLLSPKKPGLQGNLAAVNWTFQDVSYRAVFTQDEDGSLVSYVKSNESWTFVNISNCFNDSGLAIRTQSPLAAVAMSDPTDWGDATGNNLHVFFADPGNGIVEIVTHSPDLTVWEYGTVLPHTNHTLQISQDSQLAATWRRCSNETSCGRGVLFLTWYLEPSLMIANSTYDWEPSIAVNRIDGYGLTLMSAQSLLPNTADVFLSESDYAWAIYEDGGQVATAWQDYQHDWNWTDTSKTITDLPYPMNSPLQSLAAASIKNRTYEILAGLGNTDGTPYGNYFDPLKYTWVGAQPLTLQNVSSSSAAKAKKKKTQFSTIAMTADAWLYARPSGSVAGGAIQEYELDEDNYYSFWFRGDVSS